MEKEAMLWEPKDGGKVRCRLCSHRCVIGERNRGFCGVRENRKGTLYTLNYALASSVSPDPIEKKPLFNFYPGTSVFSLGTIGCNFRCSYCQNYTISQTDLDETARHLTEYLPQKAVELARDYDCMGLAWTYNEPTIWFEYTYDSAKLAKENGLYTVYVTNGYMTEEALDTIAPYLDAMNIDIKGFKEEFYNKMTSAKLNPVLETVRRAVDKGIHIELTYLIIPTKNDSEKEIGEFIDWVAGIDDRVPVHFTRFHPDYKMIDLHPTPLPTLQRAREMGLEKLKYVYTGNVVGDKGENTYCYNCNEPIIKRWGFSVKGLNLKDMNKCPNCGARIDIRR